MELRKKIWDYVNSHLKDFELEGVEIAEEDIDDIENRMKEKNITLEVASDEILSSIRECLDAGLDDIEEDFED